MMLGTLGCPKHYIETVSINTFQGSGSDLPPWLAVTSQGFFVRRNAPKEGRIAGGGFLDPTPAT